MAVFLGGELSEGGDDEILFAVFVSRYCRARPHHELKVVYDDVRDVVHVHRVRHGLKGESRKCHVTHIAHIINITCLFFENSP